MSRRQAWWFNKSMQSPRIIQRKKENSGMIQVNKNDDIILFNIQEKIQADAVKLADSNDSASRMKIT
jgi:hypothetical protein